MSLSLVAFMSCEDDKENASSNGGSSVFKSGTENGHDYVDLGLTSGTKWATCNVGASEPGEYGKYYAWGETITKSTYNKESYDYFAPYGGNYSFKYGAGYTKYCTEYDYSYDPYRGSSMASDWMVDNKTTLDLEDDAAYVNWGGKWRMPTMEQLDELFNECYVVWTENYNNSTGVIFYKAKSTSDKGVFVSSYDTPSSSYTLSDVHIFLPAAGGYGKQLWKNEEFVYCWASSLLASNMTCAEALVIRRAARDYEQCDYRYLGHPVRAVCK